MSRTAFNQHTSTTVCVQVDLQPRRVRLRECAAQVAQARLLAVFQEQGDPLH